MTIINKSYINTKGFHIPINQLTDKQKELIKKELTVSPNGLGNDDIVYKLYKCKKKKYIIPRYWGVDNIGTPKKEKFKHEKRKFNFNGKLRDQQQTIVNTSIDHIREHGGGLISVGCGGGKTVMSLYIACQLGLKTLVIVNKTHLQEQWIERIKEFTDASIGIIRQNTVDIDDKDIVIGSIQSISKKNYGKKVFKQFGFVIYDEAHHVSSKYFSKSLLQTGCKYTLALSATPYRTDGLIKVMHWFLGKCTYVQQPKVNKNVIVKKIKYKSDNKLFTEKRMKIKIRNRWESIPNTTGMTTDLCKIKKRTKLQAKIIHSIIKQDNKRKILILSSRKDHIKDLKDNFDKINDVPDINTCYFHGDLSKRDRDYSRQHGDIIFGTYEIAQEGLDIPKLNTVLLLTSKKDVKQSVGRILRTILQQGDVKPLIVDFIDDLSVFPNHGRHRSKYYNNVKYDIQEYYALNKVFCTKQDYDNNKINTNIDLDKIFTIPKITEDDLYNENYIVHEEEENNNDKDIFMTNLFLI
jgi:superfamily II DNA or RNA helicase